jgi:chromosome segregation ATPase
LISLLEQQLLTLQGQLKQRDQDIKSLQASKEYLEHEVSNQTQKIQTLDRGLQAPVSMLIYLVP